MNNSEREEIFKAINAVSQKVNDMSSKLDEVMQMLNTNASEKISVNAGAISTLTEDILPTMHDDTSGLSELMDQVLTDIIPSMLEEVTSNDSETT